MKTEPLDCSVTGYTFEHSPSSMSSSSGTMSFDDQNKFQQQSQQQCMELDNTIGKTEFVA